MDLHIQKLIDILNKVESHGCVLSLQVDNNEFILEPLSTDGKSEVVNLSRIKKPQTYTIKFKMGDSKSTKGDSHE
jgi:hypothetical protein